MPSCRSLIVAYALCLAGCGGGERQPPVTSAKGSAPPPPAATPPPPAATPAPVSRWQTYNSKDGGFSVLLPTEPRLSSRPGRLFTVFFATCDYGGARYFVTYFDPPPESMAPDVVEATMKKDRDSSLWDIKGSLKSEKKITIKKGTETWPGLESVAEDAVSLWTSRVYAVGGRMYTLQVVHPIHENHAADIAKVFNSFTVSGGP